MRVWAMLGVFLVCAGGITVAVAAASHTANRTATKSVFENIRSTAAKPAGSSAKEVTVMAVGGSSAQGYDDPHLNGYLSRALGRVSARLDVPIRFVNKAKSGDIPTMFAPQYDPLVAKIHPNIVIIGWGLLNSIDQKVPKSMFSRVIRAETNMALKAGADVWLVTPPATLATYAGPEVPLEPRYVNLEIAAANSLHSPKVHVFDLFHAMRDYLVSHHLSYRPYVANKWHLNQAGHVLAGKILANLILASRNEGGINS